MSYGLLLLRVVVGGIMAAHGAQKLFGWWGGPGMAGTAAMCTNLGYRQPVLMGAALGVAELGGGLALVAGFLTPLGALAVTVVMLTAVYLVHLPRGFFNTAGGYEFNLLIAQRRWRSPQPARGGSPSTVCSAGTTRSPACGGRSEWPERRSSSRCSC